MLSIGWDMEAVGCRGFCIGWRGQGLAAASLRVEGAWAERLALEPNAGGTPAPLPLAPV